MLDAKALTLFAALAEERHFGRVAARLEIAQSAVSTQLLRLEDQLGTRLLTRGRRSAVTLTTAGHVFLEEVHLLLSQMRRAEQIGRLAGQGEAGRLSMGYVFSAAVSGILSTGLAAIKAALPALTVMAEPTDTPSQIDGVANGRFDLGVIRPRVRYPDNVDARIIHREGMVLALAENHPLAGDRITPRSLADQTFIIPQFGEGSGLGDKVMELARRGGFAPRPFIDTRDFLTAISLAASGLGVSLVPLSISRVRVPNIRYCALAEEAGQIELALIWRKGGADRIASIIGAATDARQKECAS